MVPTTALNQRKFNVCGIRVEGGEGLELARLPILLQVCQNLRPVVSEADTGITGRGENRQADDERFEY